MANIYINSGFIKKTGDTVLGDLTMASGADILFAVSGNNSIGSPTKTLGSLYVDSIYSTGIVSNDTASNIGTGIGIFYQKAATDFEFKSIVGSGNITISSGTDTIFLSIIGGTNSVSNTGTGYGWYSHADGADLVFKSVTSGNNITIGSSAGELQIGVNDDPTFNNLTAMVVSGTIVRLSGNDVIISGIGLGSGDQVYSDIELNALRFKSLLGAGSISLSSGPDTITISGSSVGSVTDGFNTGTGYGWFLTKTGTELAFKTVTSGNNITIGTSSEEIQIGVNNNPIFASVGAVVFSGTLFTGSQVYVNQATITSLTGNFISGNVISAATSLQVDGDDVVVSASNLGAGQGVFANKIADTLNFKGLSASGSITITSDANTIYISGTDTGEVNTASNVGAGIGVFKQKNGVDLEFKGLVGSGLTVSSGTNEIFLSVQDVYVNVTGDTMTGNLTMSGADILTAASNTNSIGSLSVPFASVAANAGYFNIISGNTTLQVKNYQNVIDIITPSGLNLYQNNDSNSVIYSIVMASGSTTSNANFDIQTVSIPTNSSCLIESRVVARRTGGTAGTAGDGATYVRTVMAKNIAGTVTLGTIQSSYTNEDQPAWNATFVASSPSVLVRVNGATNNNINWHVTTILQRTL